MIIMIQDKKLVLPPGTKIPNHVAIIPDGNRRWARERGLPTFEGHRKGFDAGINLVKACRDFGVHTVSFWSFSTENWNRSKEEVSYLMKLYEGMVYKILDEALKEGVKIIHLGRKDRIPVGLARKLHQAEEKTVGLTKHILNIALDYGGRDEIIRAIKKITNSSLHQGFAGQAKFQIPNLTEENFNDYLDTIGQPYPYPDLLIRTGAVGTQGNWRTSGFLLWQMAYAEFYFAKKYFPDMTARDIYEAILEFSHRERRFGR
jgi:undecaprenyl diphosphate synthase